MGAASQGYAEPVQWSPTPPRFRPLRLVLSLLVGAAALWVASLLPGVHVKSVEGALIDAALIGVFNALLPPIVAALRLPFTLVLGFLAVLAVDAAILLIVSSITPSDFSVDSFGWALAAALVMSAASMVLQVILGVNDEDAYSLRVIERVARRQGEQTRDGCARASSSWRSTGWRSRCCSGRCATATRRCSPGGCRREAIAWSSGRPTCPRRPAPARRGSCSVQTTISPPSAGSRRRRAG